jgi:hypothetical protein
MMKAAAPMTGGIRAPPVEVTASMAPATWGSNPVLFIIGMVKIPSTVTLATALPEIVPKRELERTEIFAGPPVSRPKRD